MTVLCVSWGRDIERAVSTFLSGYINIVAVLGVVICSWASSVLFPQCLWTCGCEAKEGLSVEMDLDRITERWCVQSVDMSLVMAWCQNLAVRTRCAAGACVS